ncbi:formate dehydrogenase [Mesorhizobium sp. M7A.F.Ca.CA.001.07.2.1]|uniref:FdhF/YdeP family oxidoreductase n=4 Tax=Phyllobacteriaceae TaxID=69277 RepID=UPI000FCC5312|nr:MULTISPECIES: FdhF/YdeP family oxidoreductase [Mesorhizobium]MCF6126284.1 FdhF/YdeP family oxidoreductase [Mesorhizobium ciceri]MCQ8816296.1 FdhF/YdeP family oxidoreductase [Mesorhizobium sp. SEMIA396]RUX82375.1 formate dehydrogenase [Mesorhizobium sp. M7A.F.Ca.CA.004.08.2.1]RUX87884.1 formate dehydrogenase [Mesorhizobium sp. M7A.F.Ca.CA.004.08.1.1]RUY02876.1 formate dehydrogenase [Mesorhizobium sp. M7A.F.Ca.CA.004.04.1.1]
MSGKKRIERYDEAAGGWGALKALGEHLVEQDIAIKGATTLLRMNQPLGFDCPGCAWPDPKHTSPFEFCENGGKAVAWEVTAKRCTPEFFAAHTVTELSTWSDYELEMVGRLTHPMAYDQASDRYLSVNWDDAFAMIGRHLGALPNPNMAEFYTSGRTSNEAAFLYQLFVREYGTNNFPDCSNMCHEATSVGLPQSLGVGKGTVLLDDFDKTDCIFIFGQNPGTNSPRMMTSLRSASRRGATIISFNPFRERALERFQAPQSPIEMTTLTSTPISSRLHQVKVGGDIAVLKGLMKVLVEEDERLRAEHQIEALDWDFIRGHTVGIEALVADLKATCWEDIERRSGLTRSAIEEAAHVYMKAKRAIVVYGMGITQHRHGAKSVQQLANLCLLKGNIGKEGAGLCPVRGHSNVQGDRTVGITEIPTPEFLGRLGQRFGFEPSAEHGHNVVTALEAMVEGKARVFIGMGGNIVAAIPDWQVTQEAFRRLDLTVHVSTKLNRSHIIHGRDALILPCLGRTEVDLQAAGPQSITVEDSMSMVHASTGMNEPASEHLKSEPAIVAGMARATLGMRSVVDWEIFVADYDLIRDAIEDVFPIFEGYNARIRVPGGFHLPSTARERIWNTATGKANFMPFDGLGEDNASDADVLWLTSVRSHDQYNTTLYSLSDRYRGVFGQRDVLFISVEEIEKRGFKPGDRVDLVTVSDDGVERVVRNFKLVAHAFPAGGCAAYYPETNPLVPLHAHDPMSFTPSYKGIPIRIVRAQVQVEVA